MYSWTMYRTTIWRKGMYWTAHNPSRTSTKSLLRNWDKSLQWEQRTRCLRSSLSIISTVLLSIRKDSFPLRLQYSVYQKTGNLQNWTCNSIQWRTSLSLFNHNHSPISTLLVGPSFICLQWFEWTNNWAVLDSMETSRLSKWKYFDSIWIIQTRGLSLTCATYLLSVFITTDENLSKLRQLHCNLLNTYCYYISK